MSVLSQPSRVKILIAEDSPTQALMLKRTLETRGYEVETARNGQDALDHLLELRKDAQVWQNHRPALLISDIVMPELDGCQLCHRLKTDEGMKELPVILLTSLSDSRDALRGLYSGADNLISKPYEAAFLLARVDDILEGVQHEKTLNSDRLMPISMDGQKYLVSSDRLRVINLILTTYETAVQKNLQLAEAQNLIRKQKTELETAQETIDKQAAELEELRRA